VDALKAWTLSVAEKNFTTEVYPPLAGTEATERKAIVSVAEREKRTARKVKDISPSAFLALCALCARQRRRNLCVKISSSPARPIGLPFQNLKY
jgi:hypothetical protein